MRRVTLAEATRLRATPGATVALFLTDRCPVGCAHCSVASLPDSATIRDWPLFTEVVAGICALGSVRAVAITGGEPFAEPRGLRYAAEALHAAGIAVIVFTSGHWAGSRVPDWIVRVLRLTSTVYLSTDRFHAAALAPRGQPAPSSVPPRGQPATSSVPPRGQPAPSPALPSRVRRAASAITSAGCHLVLQVLDEPGLVAAARQSCPEADVSVVAPLAVGRATGLFPPAAPRASDHFGPCTLVNSPTVRYDGTVTACCNEAVIMGRGPDALRRRLTNRDDLARLLADLRAEPVTAIMAEHGPRGLQTVAPGPHRGICEPCWSAHDLARRDVRARAHVTVLGSRP